MTFLFYFQPFLLDGYFITQNERSIRFMKKTWKRLCTGFLVLATVVTALPITPVHAESKQYWTLSVAWCRNSSPDRRDAWKSRNSIRKISLTNVWSFKRHKKQGRHSERLTDQRQRELPVPMSDQPQLQAFQRRVLKKCRKSNVLPQRPLQR